MKRFIARLFGLHLPEELDQWRAGLDREVARSNRLMLQLDKRDTEPTRPLPWHPFHPEPLKNPEMLLRGHQDTQVVRAIMQLLEAEAQSEHEAMLTGTTEYLSRGAGATGALLEFHTLIERLVKQGPPDKSTDV